MRRLFSFALLFAAVVVTGIVRADDAPADEPTFDELARQGDLARFAGRNSDAVRAYTRALKLRNDPRLEGRLGLVALAGGAPALAAPHLLRAIIDGHAIPSGERQQIKDAFDRARALVSRINIKISHLGTDVTIDGKPESMGISATDFYVFRAPGHHEFRATLEGFEDAVVVLDTKKGETLDVALVLVPLHETPPEPVPVVTCEPCEQKADSTPNDAPKPAQPVRLASIQDEDKRVRGQWVPGIGFTANYGAVSPHPAMGIVASSHWKWNSVVSVGFDFRAAMSERGIEGYEIRGTSFTLLPGFCATRAFFTGCLTGHGGIIWHSSNAPKVSIVRPSGGGGISLGFRFARYGPIDFRTTLYGELLRDRYPLDRGRKGLAFWTGPPFIAGLSITAVLNR